MASMLINPLSTQIEGEKPIVRFEVEEDLLLNDLTRLHFYRQKPNIYNHQQFVNVITALREFCTDEGQKVLFSKFLATVSAIWGLYIARMEGNKQMKALLHTFEMQRIRLANLISKNSVLNQHYNIAINSNPLDCVFVKAQFHKVCENHGVNENFSFYYDTPFVTTPIKQLSIKGLVDPNAAWGTFADLGEYEQYVALISNNRIMEASAFAAGLAGGAHAHSLRDPFPFGHCKLLLFKSEFWSELFRHGEDTLTKQDLIDNRDKLDLEKIVVYTLDAANNQAHLSMQRTAPGGTSVLVDVKQLITFLDKAFEDGVCDFEELSYIYYNIKPAKRK